MLSPGGSVDPGAAVTVGSAARTLNCVDKKAPTLPLTEIGPRICGRGIGGGSSIAKARNASELKPVESVMTISQPKNPLPAGMPESNPPELRVRPPSEQ